MENYVGSRAAPWAKPLAIRTRLTSVIAVRQCLISVSPDNALVTSPSRSHISSVVGNVSLRERIPWKVGTSLINRLGDQVEIKIFQTNGESWKFSMGKYVIYVFTRDENEKYLPLYEWKRTEQRELENDNLIKFLFVFYFIRCRYELLIEFFV